MRRWYTAFELYGYQLCPNGHTLRMGVNFCPRCGADKEQGAVFREFPPPPLHYPTPSRGGVLLLRNALVVDGIGWAPPIGSWLGMSMYDDHLGLGPEPYQVDTIEIPLWSLRDVQIEGGSATSGGGFIGGGFGAKGAIEGIAISTALNAVTTKRSKWVLVSITADGGSVILRLDGASESQVKVKLRSLRDATVTPLKPPLPSVAESGVHDESDDLVGSLERLGQLHDSGVLTEDEFQRAKSRLIGPPDQAEPTP